MNRVYYRGMIDFCNYSCSYCPFAKKRFSEEKIEKEKASLQQLYDKIRKMQEVELMFTPYGEALVHDFYQEELIRFAKLPNVRAVGIQTNLSLENEKFFTEIKNYNDKIKLWATYHCEYADLDRFAEKANRLSQKLDLSVGMVASGENLGKIYALRQRLNPEIYLWLNAMDKRKYSFSEEEVMHHYEIDPMFIYEFRSGRENSVHPFTFCCSYEHLYIDNGFYSSNCFFKKKHSIPEDCNDHKRCDCYLGYSNFKNTPVSNFFGNGLTFRVPQKRQYKALFIDLDGILTDLNGQCRKDLEEILTLLNKKTKLYLATARSLSSAQKKLGTFLRYFSGGVFSDGALAVDFEKNYQRIVPLNKKLLEGFLTSALNEKEQADLWQKNRTSQEKLSRKNGETDTKVSPKTMMKGALWEDYQEDMLLRVRIKMAFAKKFESEEIGGERNLACQSVQQVICGIQKNLGYRLRRYGSRCYIQSEEADKKSGMLFLMDMNGWKKEEVFFISDNLQDRDIFVEFPYTATPIGNKEIEDLSYYNLDLQHLGFIIR